jgi:hypothetical protein
MIDALRRPRSQNELVGDDAKPGPDEDPFFVLLEDDSQVSHLSVETDTLLDPASLDDFDQRKVRLVITVELRPYNVAPALVRPASAGRSAETAVRMPGR